MKYLLIGLVLLSGCTLSNSEKNKLHADAVTFCHCYKADVAAITYYIHIKQGFVECTNGSFSIVDVNTDVEKCQ